MKLFRFSLHLLLTFTVQVAKSEFGESGLCVIGCTPYINWDDYDGGRKKYDALIEHLAEDCDIIVHIGDTKVGKQEKCTDHTMTRAVKALRDAGADTGKLVLYAPGDNEIVDCHRPGSVEGGKLDRNAIYKSEEARLTIVKSLGLDLDTDLTGVHKVDSHTLPGNITGTSKPYSCDFDKYYNTSTYAVATLEVVGSSWYLADERYKGYPNHDKLDPLEDRLDLYLNAKDCAVDWVGQSAEKANKYGLRAVFFMAHSKIYSLDGTDASGRPKGPYWNQKLKEETGIRNTYQPLFDKLVEVSITYPDIMFYLINSDGHRHSDMRMIPQYINYVDPHGEVITRSNQNLYSHMIEGASRGLTMYSKFLVDASKFQPVTTKEEWSENAYNAPPEGHTYRNY